MFDRCHRGDGFDATPLADLAVAHCGSDADAADLFNIHERTFWNWRYRTVCLNPFAADRYSICLGVHPSAVWGRLWFQKAEPEQ